MALTAAQATSGLALTEINSALLLGSRLKAVRESLGASLEDTASKIEIQPSIMNAIENNAYNTLSLTKDQMKATVVKYTKYVRLDLNLTVFSIFRG